MPFLDETQLMLLAMLRTLALALLASSILGLGASLLLGMARPLGSRLAAAGGYLFLALFGLSCLVFSAGLGILAGGLPPLP